MGTEWLPVKVYSQENRAGGSHTTNIHTHRLSKKSLYTDFFVQHRFWFCGLQTQTLIHLTTLDLSIFIYVYTFSLSHCKVNASSKCHRSRLGGKNQTLQMNRAGQGMLVSAACVLHSDYSHQSSTGYLKSNCSTRIPWSFWMAPPAPPPPPSQTLYIGYN